MNIKSAPTVAPAREQWGLAYQCSTGLHRAQRISSEALSVADRGTGRRRDPGVREWPLCIFTRGPGVFSLARLPLASYIVFGFIPRPIRMQCSRLPSVLIGRLESFRNRHGW